jgi:hypothetical protein
VIGHFPDGNGTLEIYLWKGFSTLECLRLQAIIERRPGEVHEARQLFDSLRARGHWRNGRGQRASITHWPKSVECNQSWALPLYGAIAYLELATWRGRVFARELNPTTLPEGRIDPILPRASRGSFSFPPTSLHFFAPTSPQSTANTNSRMIFADVAYALGKFTFHPHLCPGQPVTLTLLEGEPPASIESLRHLDS